MFAFIWDPLVLIFPVTLLLFCYLTGDLAQMIFQTHSGICTKVLSGFVLLLCLFHLISLPFMFLDWSFTILYYIFLCCLIAVLIAYAVFAIIRKAVPFREDFLRLKETLSETARRRWWMLLLWAAVLILILWHISSVILRVGINVDDNFYVSETLTILTRDRLMTVLPSCGIDGSVFPATYILVSWETLLAAFSKLFSVSPAILVHSILPALLIPLHYMAYYIAGREIVKNKTAVFMFLVVLLNQVCGPSTYNQGAFLTLRIWQGKSVLVNILLPLLLFVFLRITKEKKIQVKTILFLFAILLAGQAATTVGTYLVPVLYAVYALTFLLLSGKWRPFWKLLLPAAGITPFVLWKLWILLSAGTLGSLSEGTGVFDRSFTELAMSYIGFSLIALFFLLALVILAFQLKSGKERALRWFFPITSAILFLFFINPFVMPFVERFITGVGVYWRMFWLLQITLVIAAGFTLLTTVPRLILARVSIFLFLSVAVLLSGRSIWKDEDVREESYEDFTKISKTSRSIADTIMNEIARNHPDAPDSELLQLGGETILLLPRSLSEELRQYADISLIYYPYYSNNYYAYQTDEEYELLRQLYIDLYSRKTWEKHAFSSAVRTLGIDYVAIGTGTAEANAANIPSSFTPVYSGERYSLYKTSSGQ